jgi:hypothetical protein
MSLKQRACGSVASKPTIAFDLRQEPGAGKLHAGIVGEVSSNRHLYPTTALTPCHASGIVRCQRSVGGGEHRPAIEPRKSFTTRDADAVLGAEGNMDGRDIARSGPIPRGQRPWHVRTRDRLCLHIGPHREGEEP